MAEKMAGEKRKRKHHPEMSHRELQRVVPLETFDEHPDICVLMDRWVFDLEDMEWVEENLAHFCWIGPRGEQEGNDINLPLMGTEYESVARKVGIERMGWPEDCQVKHVIWRGDFIVNYDSGDPFDMRKKILHKADPPKERQKGVYVPSSKEGYDTAGSRTKRRSGKPASRFRGVSKETKGELWRAQITTKGKELQKRGFATEYDAAHYVFYCNHAKHGSFPKWWKEKKGETDGRVV